MNKTTKGAVAAAAAGVLLLGGAGSLAYWSEAETVTGSSINSGSLALTAPTGGVWTLNGTTVNPTTVEVVPGDQLEYTGSYTIDAEGENLEATVGVTGGAATGNLADNVVTQLVAAEIDGSAVNEVTDANDGDVLRVVVRVSFPFNASAEQPVDNTSQNSTLNLSDIAVTLTQTDATP